MILKNKNVTKTILITFSSIAIALISLLVVNQNHRQTHAFAIDGEFYLSPDSATFKKGCESSVNVMINTGSNESNAANIIVNYNPSEIEIIDTNPSISGIQIEKGTAYEAYADNVTDESTGKIRLTGFSITSPLKGSGVFATIRFISKPGVETTNLSIVFDGIGKTLDSNIAELYTSDDVLASVGSGTYTFTEGRCFEDTTPPTVEPIYPKNFDLNVSKNATLEVKICDNDSGVDIKTVSIDLLGEVYTYTDTENFVYTGDPSCYNIKLKPKDELPINEAVLVVYKAKDFKGNSGQATVIFNIPGEANEIIKQIIEKEKEIEECEENLTNCQMECKQEIDLCRSIGVSDLFSILTGKKTERKDGNCPLAWLSLIAFLILFFFSYIRNFVKREKMNVALKAVLTVLFTIGCILAFIGIFRCYSLFTIVTLLLYLLISLYMGIAKALPKLKGQKN